MRWSLALVSGPSMLPTLADGDRVLVRRVVDQQDVRPDAIVVARLAERPGLLVVKRALRRHDEDGWVLGPDNPAVTGHGLTGGPGHVQGVVTWRYWPWPPRRPA